MGKFLHHGHVKSYLIFIRDVSYILQMLSLLFSNTSLVIKYSFAVYLRELNFISYFQIKIGYCIKHLKRIWKFISKYLWQKVQTCQNVFILKRHFDRTLDMALNLLVISPKSIRLHNWWYTGQEHFSFNQVSNNVCS